MNEYKWANGISIESLLIFLAPLWQISLSKHGQTISIYTCGDLPSCHQKGRLASVAGQNTWKTHPLWYIYIIHICIMIFIYIYAYIYIHTIHWYIYIYTCKNNDIYIYIHICKTHDIYIYIQMLAPLASLVLSWSFGGVWGPPLMTGLRCHRSSWHSWRKKSDLERNGTSVAVYVSICAQERS